MQRALLLLLISPALACPPPPAEFEIVDTFPAEGEVAPAGSPFVIHLTDHYEIGAGMPAEEFLELEVLDAEGAAVPGTLEEPWPGRFLQWRPESGERSGRYTANILIRHPWDQSMNQDYAIDFAIGVDEAFVGEFPEPPELETWAEAHAVFRCVEEQPVGSCEGCETEQVGESVWFHATITAPQVEGPFTGAMRYSMVYGADEQEVRTLVERGIEQLRKSGLEGPTFTLAQPFERFGEQICVHVRAHGPGGEVRDSGIVCTGWPEELPEVDPIEEEEEEPHVEEEEEPHVEEEEPHVEEEEPEELPHVEEAPEQPRQAEEPLDDEGGTEVARKRDPGCSATDHGSKAGWLLMLPLLALRRPTRRATRR